MLESIFIMTTLIAIAFMILAIEKESIAYSILSVLFWFIVMGGQIVIEVPITDATYYSASAGAYFFVALGGIFTNIVWQLLLYFDVVGTPKEENITNVVRENRMPRIPK